MLSLARQAWAFANQAFSYVWYMFDQLLRVSGMKPIYLVMVLFAIVFRLLAAPLVGAGLAAGSDVYKKGIMKAKGPASDSKEISRID